MKENIKQIKYYNNVRDFHVHGYMNTINYGVGGESNYYDIHPVGYDFREYILTYRLYDDSLINVQIKFNKNRELWQVKYEL